MLTHRNIAAMAMSYFIDVDPPAPGCIVHAAPMSHGSGIYIIPQVVQGNCQVVPESGQFDPAEIFELLRHWARRVDVRGTDDGQAPGSIILTPRRHGPISIRAIAYGGAPMYVADLKQAIGPLRLPLRPALRPGRIADDHHRQ